MMRRAEILCIFLALLWGSGCRHGREPATSAPTPRIDVETAEAIMPPDRPDPETTKRFRLLVQMRIGAVETPVGAATGSEELWTYLNEEMIRPVHAAALGRNGFRVGIGREDAWPDVARILRRLTGSTVELRSAVALPGDPMAVDLKRDQPAATIFTFYDDRTLRGSDYPAGDYVLAALCTVDESDPSHLLLTGTPQVRVERQRTRVLRDGGGFRLGSRPRYVSLDPLTFRVPVKPGDFVVIGPGAAAKREVSPGHHFLTRTRDGVEFETVLVLMPQAVRAAIESNGNSR